MISLLHSRHRHQPDHLRRQVRPPPHRAGARHRDQADPEGHRQVALRRRVPDRRRAARPELRFVVIIALITISED